MKTLLLIGILLVSGSTALASEDVLEAYRQLYNSGRALTERDVPQEGLHLYSRVSQPVTAAISDPDAYLMMSQQERHGRIFIARRGASLSGFARLVYPMEMTRFRFDIPGYDVVNLNQEDGEMREYRDQLTGGYFTMKTRIEGDSTFYWRSHRGGLARTSYRISGSKLVAKKEFLLMDSSDWTEYGYIVADLVQDNQILKAKALYDAAKPMNGNEFGGGPIFLRSAFQELGDSVLFFGLEALNGEKRAFVVKQTVGIHRFLKASDYRPAMDRYGSVLAQEEGETRFYAEPEYDGTRVRFTLRVLNGAPVAKVEFTASDDSVWRADPFSYFTGFSPVASH